MSETAAPEAELSSEDHGFFRAIEERFVALRGTATLLSPADWQLARAWRREGIPLDAVLEGLERAFARHRERGRTGRISSLRYCRPLVEEVWRERRDLGVLSRRSAPAPALEVYERLARLAAVLPPGLPRRQERAAEIAGLSGEPAAVETRLAAIEERWLGEELAHLDDAGRAEVDRVVARSLAAVSGRLDAAAVEAARAPLRLRALKRRLGLPDLSLFSPIFLDEPPEE
ncbi:MAG: hypothetical protein KJ058_02905 [Thermoanaerobaculia bacterium]|nr:hypothetical protein [Thermoanaerobaculia bacterium]MCZ7650881.1 hypothetical protein [Thermoanaerobaculia bacterium]